MDKNKDPFYSASNIKELEKRLDEAKMEMVLNIH